jgi:hypothetical protein
VSLISLSNPAADSRRAGVARGCSNSGCGESAEGDRLSLCSLCPPPPSLSARSAFLTAEDILRQC